MPLEGWLSWRCIPDSNLLLMPKSSLKTLIIHFVVVYVIFLALSSILGVVMRGRPLNSQDFIVGAVVASLLAFRRYLRDKALQKDNSRKADQ